MVYYTTFCCLRLLPDSQHYHNICSVGPCTCSLQPPEGNPALQPDCHCGEPLREWTGQPLNFQEEREASHGKMVSDQQQGSCSENVLQTTVLEA